MAATFEPTPLHRKQTTAERRHIADVSRSLDERIAILRDTRSADGIQQSVLDKWARINPPERGQ